MQEIWENIKGYEGVYQVSNFGRVKSFKLGKENILKEISISTGYKGVNLYKNGILLKKTVHQLVAEAFLGHTPCGMELVINHINFDKTDNRVDNLEIVTQRENSNRKHLKKTSRFTGVSWCKRDNNWLSCITIKNKKMFLGRFSNEIEASKAYERALQEFTHQLSPPLQL